MSCLYYKGPQIGAFLLKNMSTKITNTQIQHIAKLANIPVSDEEATKLAAGFEKTLETIADLKAIDTTGVTPTSQVTGLENVWREDIADEKRTFTQKEALANAKATYNGYFVVPRLIKK